MNIRARFLKFTLLSGYSEFSTVNRCGSGGRLGVCDRLEEAREVEARLVWHPRSLLGRGKTVSGLVAHGSSLNGTAAG